MKSLRPVSVPTNRYLALPTRQVPLTALGEPHRYVPLPAFGLAVMLPIQVEPGSGIICTGQVPLNSTLPLLSTAPLRELSLLVMRPLLTMKKPVSVLVFTVPPPDGQVKVKS
jgi:hypothetical protein